MSKVIRLQNGRTEVLDGIRDLEGLVEDEIFEAITYFFENHDNETLQDEYDSLEQEFKSYEASNDSYYSCLNDLNYQVEKILNTLEDTDKKLNRKELIKLISAISNDINNEI